MATLARRTMRGVVGPLEMPTPGTVVYLEASRAVNVLRKIWGEDKLSDVEAAAIRSLARRHQQCTDRLHRIWGAESKEKREHTRDLYLSAYTTRVCATVRAFAKTKRRGTLQDIYRFAGKLDVWQPLWEPVRVKLLPKSKGGVRAITRDGPRRMAQRFIVRDLLTAVGVDNDFDYCRRGAGGEKAMIRGVSQRIEMGYRHWRTADVVNCFASLKRAHLGWLPLPKELIRNVVFLPRCTKMEIVKGPVGKEVSQSGTPTVSGVSFPYMGSSLVPMKKLRRELPQGSVLSPLVVRAFLGRELGAVPGHEEVAIFSFVDDLTLGARSRPEVDHALDALRERLQGHPAGAVLLHIDPPTSVDRGRVKALGYVLQPGRGYGDTFVHVFPGRQRFDRFHRKLYDRWKAVGKPSGDAMEDLILERLAHWMPSQQAWTIVPVCSQNLALTCAVVYVCEKEREEIKQPKFQIATAAE
jgi:hypothetical protein